MEKKFKTFDRVLIKDNDGIWQIDFYSYKDSDDLHHVMTYGESNSFIDEYILTFEGNEHLVGTDLPVDEEVIIHSGSKIMAFTDNENWIYAIFSAVLCEINQFEVESSNGSEYRVDKIIRFSDFNPNDMEETKKHILVVKNGKIIRYKG